MIVIITMMPSKMMPTRGQFRVLSAKISGVPIPLPQ